ncbi:MAG: DUF1015 domain-containing protein [Candidatus Bathyarchaeia archaeon]
MVDIRPFKAIHYTEKAGNLENLITQPYDKIDAEMQRKYYAASPYNYCLLILPREPNRYETVRQRIQQWTAEHVLAKDAEPSVFVCRETFKLDGEVCSRTGLIAALQLYDYGEGVVFPHETTYAAPKADRLNMLRTVQKDLEPVFFIYSDPKKATMTFFQQVARTQPIIQVEDAFGVQHTVWRVTDPAKISLVQDALREKSLVITDGHHRYESALAYRDERRKQENWAPDSAFNFHLSMMVPIQDEGLVVLPTHRLLKDFKLTDAALEALKRIFVMEEIEPSAAGLDGFLETHNQEHAFCIYTSTKAYGLLLKHEPSVYEYVAARTSKETKLFDVVILRDVIFKAILKTGDLKPDEDILYVRWTKTAVEKVDSGEATMAFLINPISPQTVWQIALQRERLPEKSTDFYPKMVSGLVMMDIAPGEKL